MAPAVRPAQISAGPFQVIWVEQLTRDLLDQTALQTQEVLHESGLSWSDVDQVLLEGGATRMPAVHRMLEELTGRPPATFDPGLAVAQGAALFAAKLSTKQPEEVISFEKEMPAGGLERTADEKRTPDRESEAACAPRTATPEQVGPEILEQLSRDLLPSAEAAIPPSVPAVESPAEAVGRGDEIVLRLRDLLLDRISPQTRKYLERKFEAYKFTGRFEDRLVEYCLEQDPVEILAELFANPELVAMVEPCGNGQNLPEELPLMDKQTLCRLVLDRLGFKRVETPRGIRQMIGELEQARAKLAKADDPTFIRGCVLDAGRKAEGVLQDLVRFYGALLLPNPYEQYLREWKWNSSGKPVAALTFGQLLEVLGHFERAIERREPPGIAERFEELFPGRSLFGGSYSEARTRSRPGAAKPARAQAPSLPPPSRV